MTTAATADLKKTQNVRKVELHTAHNMRKIGTCDVEGKARPSSSAIPFQHTPEMYPNDIERKM